MNKFRDWYIRNQDAITWFIIGWLAFGMLDNIVKREYIWALVQAGLIWLNYKLLPHLMR
jgi:hypothetical protein